MECAVLLGIQNFNFSDHGFLQLSRQVDVRCLSMIQYITHENTADNISAGVDTLALSSWALTALYVASAFFRSP
jgi:hypothetical protein